MIKPKISTTISKLLEGDYFVPDGENVVYDFAGYDDEWFLWVGINLNDGKVTLFDDMPCLWLPNFDDREDDVIL